MFASRPSRFTAALLLTSALVMGGCSPKDEGPSADVSAPAKALGLTGPSDKAFAKHFAVPKRAISDDEAQKALALLNMDAPSGDALSWDEMSGAAGNYSYKGLSTKTDEGLLTIDKVNLIGVHMAGGEASFDRADFSGLSLYDQEDDVTVTVDTLSLARPTPAMAQQMIEALQQIKDVKDMSVDLDGSGDEDDASFGALGLSGMTLTSETLKASAQTLMWAEDAQTALADFKIDDIVFSGTGDQGGAYTGKLGSFFGTGFKSSAYGQMSGMAQSPLSLMGGINPLAKTYDSLKLSGLDFDSDFVSVDFDGYEGKAVEKNGVTTLTEVSEPFVVKLKQAPAQAQTKRLFDMAKSLEFDTLVFQSSQTTVMDANKDTVELKNGLLTMKDGFDLSYSYGASGIKAMTQALSAAGDNASEAQMMASLESLKINGFQMRLEDKSIVERGVKLAAQTRGGTPESVRKELAAVLTLAPLMAGGGLEGDMIKEMSQAFGDFVKNGGTLSVVMQPETPVAASEMVNFKNSQMRLEDLGFSAKAE